MIQNTNVKLVWHRFLVEAELEPDVDLEHIENKLVDSLTWVEGAGKTVAIRLESDVYIADHDRLNGEE